uniref:Putative secreted protein n=1 Tax=Rhipicephalus microplus TaxID=6941 RepID=A0A6M2DCB7_RHIMP
MASFTPSVKIFPGASLTFCTAWAGPCEVTIVGELCQPVSCGLLVVNFCVHTCTQGAYCVRFAYTHTYFLLSS